MNVSVFIDFVKTWRSSDCVGGHVICIMLFVYGLQAGFLMACQSINVHFPFFLFSGAKCFR